MEKYWSRSDSVKIPAPQPQKLEMKPDGGLAPQTEKAFSA
jgi:hypothetical protein